MPKPTIFGERLKQARELRSLTQAELADKAKLRAIQISHFETGVRPSASADTLVKLANALSVSIDYLLGRSDKIQAQGGKVEAVLRSLNGATDDTIDAVAEIARTLAKRDEQRNE